jgi:hypothetical protein
MESLCSNLVLVNGRIYTLTRATRLRTRSRSETAVERAIRRNAGRPPGARVIDLRAAQLCPAPSDAPSRHGHG